MKEKWTPHIIAATALAVFIVLGLACATKPKAPKEPVEIVYNPAGLSGDQLATLFIPPGYVNVHHFNGEELPFRWHQQSIYEGGMNVKIPSGNNIIRFDYYAGGEFQKIGGVETIRDAEVSFTAVAGRNYILNFAMVRGSYNFNYTSSSSTWVFFVTEISDTREPGPDEQVILFSQKKYSPGLLLGVLDKGTDNERSFILGMIGGFGDTRRAVVPKGEHTIDIVLGPNADKKDTIQPVGEPPRNFSVSANPVKFTVTVQSKADEVNVQYTLTQQ